MSPAMIIFIKLRKIGDDRKMIDWTYCTIHELICYILIQYWLSIVSNIWIPLHSSFFQLFIILMLKIYDWSVHEQVFVLKKLTHQCDNPLLIPVSIITFLQFIRWYFVPSVFNSWRLFFLVSINHKLERELKSINKSS